MRFSNSKKKFIAVLISLLIGLCLIFIRKLGTFQSLELKFYDLYLKSQFEKEAPNTNIVLICIDENDIQHEEYGGWPLEDKELAHALNLLGRFNPVVIGLDLFRDLPIPQDGSGLPELNEALLKQPVIAITQLGNKEQQTIKPPPILADRPDRISVNEFPIDSDNMLRRAFLYLDDGQNVFYSLAFQLALVYLQGIDGFSIDQDPQNPERIRIGKTWFEPFEKNDGAYVNADARGYSYFLDFKNPKDFLTYSLTDLLSGNVKKEDIEGKIALIGATAESLRDYYPTVAATHHYGIQLHAMSLQQILRSALHGDRPMQSLTESQENLFILLFSLSGALFCFGNRFTILKVAGVILFLTITNYTCFFIYEIWIPAVTGTFAVSLSSFGVIFYMYLVEGKEKREIRKMFSTMVSPKVLKYMQDQPDRFNLGGEKKMATIFFSDLADFTSISEQLPPDDLAKLLNSYLTPMSDIIMEYGGYIDKFEGDAIMADFGVPIWFPGESNSHAWKACWSALDQKKKLIELNTHINYQLKVRVGINTGLVSAGNMGSNQKFQYTVMGDIVNQAARFETANKMFGTDTIIGEKTYQMAKEKIEGRFLGLLKVKGKSEAVKIYELLAKKGELDEHKHTVLDLFENAWNLYARREFQKAISQFEACLELDPQDGPAKAYSKICQYYLSHPQPRDWSGEWNQHFK